MVDIDLLKKIHQYQQSTRYQSIFFFLSMVSKLRITLLQRNGGMFDISLKIIEEIMLSLPN